MANEITIALSGSQLAVALGLPLKGLDLPLEAVHPLPEIKAGSLSFSRNEMETPVDRPATIIGMRAENPGAGALLVSDNPRLDFARALQWIKAAGGFDGMRQPPELHPTVVVGKGVFIDDAVVIGKGTVIGHNVVISSGVRIGANCVIKSGAVIGEDGFGFERDGAGVPIRLVHLGGVSIGDNVEVGSLTTVCRGTLSDTVIEDDAKIDDHVHIAHNVRVGRGALITACAEISGGVSIADGVWIGPNASVMQKIEIGRGALVGIGSNVIRSVPDGLVVAGNPARVINGK